MDQCARKGEVTVIKGPMYCGKSTELIRFVKRQQYADKKVQVFRPVADTRSPSNTVQSRDMGTIEAAEIDSLDEIPQLIDAATQVIAIDEVQFLPGIADFCVAMADKGLDVIVAGLDFTYQGTPFRMDGFGCIQDVVAEKTISLTAVCMQKGCDNEAVFSERIVRGDGIKLTGDKEAYRAVCRQHYGTYRLPSPIQFCNEKQ